MIGGAYCVTMHMGYFYDVRNSHRALFVVDAKRDAKRQKPHACMRSPPICILRLRRLDLRIALCLLRRLCCRLLLSCPKLLNLVHAVLLADGLAHLDLGHFLRVDALLSEPVRGARWSALAVGVERTRRRPPLRATGKAAQALVSCGTYEHERGMAGVRTLPSAFPAPPGLTFEALGAPRPGATKASNSVEPGKTPLLLMLPPRPLVLRAAVLSTGGDASCCGGVMSRPAAATRSAEPTIECSEAVCCEPCARVWFQALADSKPPTHRSASCKNNRVNNTTTTCITVSGVAWL